MDNRFYFVIWQPPPIITVALKVLMHCEACAQVLKKKIGKIKGKLQLCKDSSATSPFTFANQWIIIKQPSWNIRVEKPKPKERIYVQFRYNHNNFSKIIKHFGRFKPERVKLGGHIILKLNMILLCRKPIIRHPTLSMIFLFFPRAPIKEWIR